MTFANFRRMLEGALALAVLFASPSALAAAGDSSDPKWCLTCHNEAPFTSVRSPQGAHKAENCRDCHTGYQFNPHEPVEEATSEDIDAQKKRGVKNPVAMAACMDCHDAPSETPGAFPHGKDKKGTLPGSPYCLDCHGDPHEIQMMKSMGPAARRLAMNKRCIKCHDDPKKMNAAKLNHGIVAAYDHTMHAIKLDLGSPDAPGCADCHPAHPAADAKKAAALAAGPCIKCHEGANPRFRELANHKPMTVKDRPASFYTLKFFAWLTFLTILGLSLHVVLDILNVVRRARKPTRKEEHEPKIDDLDPKLLAEVSGGRVEHKGTILRFDVHQRIAHGLMALSFTLLAFTGWPLSSHGVGASHFLVALFGGLEMTGLIHRGAAIGLVAACLYHLVYLTVALIRGRLHFTMLPQLQDVKDVIANLAWLVGLRSTKPNYARLLSDN